MNNETILNILLIAYYIGLSFVAPDLHLFYLDEISLWMLLYLMVSTIVCISTFALCYYWSKNNWGNHPIARALQHQGNNTAWTDVAARMNTEFRRIDKFTTGPPDVRVIVTDSWVMKTWAYGMNIAHNADCHLNLLRTEEHAISHENRAGVQYLAIEVISANKYIRPFEIR